MDYTGPINGCYYLVIVDTFSKCPEVVRCRKATTRGTIEILEEQFSRFGILGTIETDNGIHITAVEFKEFCSEQTAEHVPESNGCEEKFVDTFKRALKKSSGGEEMEELLQQFLAAYGQTPSPNTLDSTSTAKQMFNRKH